jgi:hydrogenase maturation protein HypF
VIRRRLVCRGAVQGVGFRPAVHRLASALGLAGSVRNDADGATIEVQGPQADVACFERELPHALPPLARVIAIEGQDLPPSPQTTFEVAPSRVRARRGALIPPDAALCPRCRAELDDPADRRSGYPFTTCTDCGPRFTLARALPYDRERTSMAPFEPCPACAAEYRDPASRRFHAEPICCPDCGPELSLLAPDGERLATQAEALLAARLALARGLVVAVHGLGGFQLACRADDPAAVARLRERKRRATKPFAVMVRDLGEARARVALGAEDEALLTGPRAPIVLARRHDRAPAGDLLAPGLDDLGVMLPTTPLHVELYRRAPYRALVMTSGNRGDEPICRTPAEALERLADVADLLLVHEREVVRRADDSVVRTAPGGPLLVRRSRGWVPEPVTLPTPAPEPVLALGGHLQATACLAVAGEAFPSQHVGDLDTDAARAFLEEVATGLEGFLQVRAGVVAVDEHPDYPSAWIGERIARERGGRLLRVQHHLAHAAAVLAEHGRFPAPGEAVAALVLDGTGYGPDGVAWGCELLWIDGDLSWRRVAGASALPLVGGERAVREPWRVACAALARAGCAGMLERLPLAARVDPLRLRQVADLAGSGSWPMARGAGRLFEAAGAMLGLVESNGWEGEAAARLEALAQRCLERVEPWEEVGLVGGELPAAALLAALARRCVEGSAPEAIARGFHATFVHLAGRVVRDALPGDVRAVALGGGCLVNRILAEGLSQALLDLDLEPLLPHELPPGDGGLSVGQAALAAVSLARGCAPRLMESMPCA